LAFPSGALTGEHYLQLLERVHRHFRPRTYLEIGVGTGWSLALAGGCSAALGIDPEPQVDVPLPPAVKVVRATSDDFFARYDLRSELGGQALDLAFIDGMHLFEFALRDFMNVERYSLSTTAIVLDDMLPRTISEASRDRTTQDWAGDVYKLIGVLRACRADLIVVPVDTQPTGVLVVLAPDRSSSVLRDRYDEIVAANVVPDPQAVPRSVLERIDAVAPEELLATGAWRTIVRSRRLHLPLPRVRAALRRELGPLLAPPGVDIETSSVGRGVEPR
jgi:hypothetical protein